MGTILRLSRMMSGHQPMRPDIESVSRQGYSPLLGSSNRLRIQWVTRSCQRANQGKCYQLMLVFNPRDMDLQSYNFKLKRHHNKDGIAIASNCHVGQP